MYHLTPFTYLIEAMVGQGRGALTSVAPSTLISSQPSAASSSSALRRSSSLCSLPPDKHVGRLWQTIFPEGVDISPTPERPATVDSARAERQMNGLARRLISFTIIIGETLGSSGPIFFST